MRRPQEPVRSSSSRSGSLPHGFTLVEMLAVIAVIAALLGVLLVGLQAAQRSSKRTKQLSNLKQVFQGWTQYAGNHGDSILPGYLDENTQAAWRVKYKSKVGNKEVVLPSEFCREYPWRLLPYLDHQTGPMYEYLDVADQNELLAQNLDGTVNTAGLTTVAERPEFGYNGYYLGGRWTANPDPVLTFGNSTYQRADGQNAKASMVATKIASIVQPSEMIVFCASTFRDPGYYNEAKDEGALGWSTIVPHILADQLIWEPSDGGNYSGVSVSQAGPSGFTNDILAQTMPVSSQAGMLVSQSAGVPLRRHGPTVALVRADGNTNATGLGDLLDQRKWMNAAWSGSNPFAFSHSP
jgi:prepilin-type N-terminal cleavage/methylation domain-containing protein